MTDTTPATTPSSAPSTDTQKALVGAFIAIQAANKAIKLQGQLPVINLPGLGSAVNTSLATAQSHAELWEKSISANVQNQLQQIIEFNSLLAAMDTSINSSLAEVKKATKENPPPSGTISSLAADISAIQSQVQSILYGSGTKSSPGEQSILGAYNQLTDYQSKVGTDASTFETYRQTAFNSKSGVSAQITQDNSDIATAQTAMAKDREILAGGAAAIVTGVLIVVVAVALAPETGGASAAAIGTVGAALAAGGVVAEGVAGANLRKNEKKVAGWIKQIAEDKAELVSLSTLGNTSKDVSQHAASIFGALGTLKTNWQQMDNDMQDFVSALNLPEEKLMEWVQNKTGKPGTYLDLAVIVGATFNVAITTDWDSSAKMAQQFLTALGNVKSFTLPTGTVPTPDAIAAAAGHPASASS